MIKKIVKHEIKEGAMINLIVCLVGIVLLVMGVLLKKNTLIHTVFLSIGTSMIASALVTFITTRYIVETKYIRDIYSKWGLLDLYESKGDMNLVANENLENCNRQIDIIAEGMYNYRSAKRDILEKKINGNIRFRIISCDSSEFLDRRAKDESLDGLDNGDNAIRHVCDLDNWVKKINKKYDNNSVEIKYHSTYPGFSYLRIDDNIYISPNLWRRPSQQSFALAFEKGGRGWDYFERYFEELWDSSFTHDHCMLNTKG